MNLSSKQSFVTLCVCVGGWAGVCVKYFVLPLSMKGSFVICLSNLRIIDDILI